MKKALSLLLGLVMVLSLCSAFGLAASADGSVVTTGASYTYSNDNLYLIDWGTVSTNASACLTDGEKESDNNYLIPYLGFKTAYGEVTSVTVTLDGTYNLTEFSVYSASGIDGIEAPEALAIEVSVDGTNWTALEAASTNTTGTKTNSWGNTITVNKTTVTANATASYIKFNMTSAGNFIFIDEVEAVGTAVAEEAPEVEAKTLGVDVVNYYDWTETDFGGDLGKTALSAGHVVMAVSDDATVTIPDKIGGAWFTWWYKVLAVWDDAAGAYVVTATEASGEAGYETWTLGEGKIAFMCNYSFSASEVAGNAADAEVLTNIVVGDKITINGTDWATLAASSGALESVSLGINAPAQSGDEPAVEEADTSLMGVAPADPAYKTTLSVENGWEAGKDLNVKVTIEALKDVNLTQVIFNLFYDASDVSPVLPEEPDLGTLVTTGADSWKDSSIFYLGEAEEGYGLLVGAPGTANKDDVLNAGDKIEITLTFKVLDTASGLINFQLSNDKLLGYTYDTPDVADVAGAGSSLAVEPYSDDLGDAGIYVIAGLSIVALLGTAIVIKKRA